ncbi:MAG: GntR family transcriptional regulator [Peptostreptococcaceae bacterium]|nr:GntR family transcriptional regulator [Peptostreptococcaceae bacterium]
MVQMKAVSTHGLPLAENLYTQIQMDIIKGILPAGKKLTEQSLCEQYKVSRTPVREALRQLEIEGLVENIPNRGSFVVGFTSQDIKDIYELRKTYEIQAVKWAIERIDDDELDELGEIFEFMEFYTKKHDIDKMLNINSNFHQLIYTSSRNKMLRQVLSSYQMYIKYSRDRSSYSNDYLEIVLEEHRAIYNAFLQKNETLAINAMLSHMENSYLRQSED